MDTPTLSFPLPTASPDAVFSPRPFHKDPLLTWPPPSPCDPPRCILLFKKWGDGEAFEAALSLGRYLATSGALVLRMPPCGDEKPLPAEFPVVALPLAPPASAAASAPPPFPLSRVDLVLCVGGDGSLLHASSLFCTACPPFIAVGRGGSLGFLTVHTPASARALLARLLHLPAPDSPTGSSHADWSDGTPLFPLPPAALLPPGVLPPPPLACLPPAPGTAIVSRRMRLRVDVYQRRGSGGGGGSSSGGEAGGGGGSGAPPAAVLTGSYLALNEMLLSRGGATYMAQVDAFVDGLPLTTVLADGLIVSTQTGSTAYALSAGGPIMSPSASCISIVPICPHTLSFRPIVFDEGAVIHLVLPAGARAPAAVTCDGRNCAELRPGDYVVVCASSWPLPLLARRSPTADWLAGIHEKMLWNIRGAEQRKLRSQAGPPN